MCRGKSTTTTGAMAALRVALNTEENRMVYLTRFACLMIEVLQLVARDGTTQIFADWGTSTSGMCVLDKMSSYILQKHNFSYNCEI